MKLIALQLMFVLAVYGQRFFSGSEVETRLLTPKQETVLSSPFCPEGSAQVKLRVVIGADGRVVSVKGAEQSSASLTHDKSKLRRLVQQAVRLVSGWKYHPMLVDGRPVSMKTFVHVRCVPQ